MAVELIECPLCEKRRTGPAGPYEGAVVRCRLCRGAGSIGRDVIEELCDQMERVANAMQAGDADRAANEARIAFRVANRILGPD